MEFLAVKNKLYLAVLLPLLSLTGWLGYREAERWQQRQQRQQQREIAIARVQMFVEALSSLQEPILAIDETDKVTLCSEGMAGLLGYSRNEVIGQKLGKFILGVDHLALVAPQLRASRRAPTIMHRNIECTLRNKEGTEIAVRVTVSVAGAVGLGIVKKR